MLSPTSCPLRKLHGGVKVGSSRKCKCHTLSRLISLQPPIRRGGSYLEGSARCYKMEPSGRKRQIGGQVKTGASGSVLTSYGKTLVYLPLTCRRQRSLAQVKGLEACTEWPRTGILALSALLGHPLGTNHTKTLQLKPSADHRNNPSWSARTE